MHAVVMENLEEYLAGTLEPVESKRNRGSSERL